MSRRAAQVAAQLRSLGVLQTCAVLKVGLPTRITYADLSASLAPALPPELLALLRADDDDGEDDADDDDDDDDDDDGGDGDDGRAREGAREAAREQRLVACVFHAFGVAPASYELGRTRAFFGPGQASVLDEILGFERADPEKVAALAERLRAALPGPESPVAAAI